jgi:voltage-gated potassium channel
MIKKSVSTGKQTKLYGFSALAYTRWRKGSPVPRGIPVPLKDPQIRVLRGVFILAAVVFAGVIGFMIIERWSFWDSLYMTVISISTVGYGEVHPLSSNGRLFASVIILAGIGSVFFATTMLGRFILEGEIRGTLTRRSMKRKTEKLKGHTVICGWGRTGKMVAEALHEEGFPFAVVERDGDAETVLQAAGYLYVIGDATEESVLRQAGAEQARTVLALLSSDADNLYLTIAAKEVNPDVKLVARALDEVAETRLRRGGADSVVSLYKIAGQRMLQAAVRPTAGEFVDLVSGRQRLSLVLEEVQIDASSGLVGRRLDEADLRNKYRVMIVAVKRASGDMIFDPDPSAVLLERDVLVAIGEKDGLKRLGSDCRHDSNA